MAVFDSLDEISLDGFQVVRGNMFQHAPAKSTPTCTIYPSRINFNKMCLLALNNCEFISIRVNPKTKCLLLTPVPSSDKDSIHWIKSSKDQTTRNLESRLFGKDIYSSWGLDESLNYRARGSLVTVNNKVMILFDFNTPEIWRNTRKEGSNG